VDESSVTPKLVAHSSCEAEYSTSSIALMAATFTRKVFNEIIGRDSDDHLTIPLGLDSQSAIDTAKSAKETQRTRHIARRYHYIRHCTINGSTIPFKISGTANWSNSLTKALPADQLNLEARVYQVEVDP